MTYTPNAPLRDPCRIYKAHKSAAKRVERMRGHFHAPAECEVAFTLHIGLFLGRAFTTDCLVICVEKQ